MADELGDDRDMNGHSDPDYWPMCENVLQSLSEDVRPAAAAVDETAVDETAVTANVLRCLAEPVTLAAATEYRSRPRPPPRDDATAAARRMQARLMAVRSAYTDGKYYEPEAPYVSRTVEELCAWTVDARTANVHTYTAGTVDYDRATGACYLHGLADPRSRVAVDCGPLTATLPRHRSTVKMFATLRTRDDDHGGTATPVLVPHHFQVFSCAALFR